MCVGGQGRGVGGGGEGGAVSHAPYPEKMPELAEKALCHLPWGVCPLSVGVAAVLCLWTAPATANATAPSATTGAMAAELSGI